MKIYLNFIGNNYSNSEETCLCILSYDSAMTARIPSRYGPLAAQSLEDPDPYSLPTRAIRLVPSSVYLSAASNTSI